MGIGNRLSGERLKSGLTQEQVAETLGITRQTLSNWENDRSVPDLLQAQSLAEIYGVNLVAFTSDAEPVQPAAVPTSSAKGLSRKERMILIGYVSAWVILSLCCCLWNFTYGHAFSYGYAIIFYIFCLPILTGVSSLLTGIFHCWKGHSFSIVFSFFLGHVLFHYINFWGFAWIFTRTIYIPEIDEILSDAAVGLIISAVMYYLGRLISWYLEKMNGEDA